MAHESRRGEYLVSDDLALIDFDVVHRVLTAIYWSVGIPRELVEKAARHSMAFGVYHAPVGDGGTRTEQVGYARVITDRATYAYLCDVFIVEAHRGRGLSTLMMEAILAHPELQGLRRFCLLTRDAQGLYERYGFRTHAPGATTYMEKLVRDIYLRENPS